MSETLIQYTEPDEYGDFSIILISKRTAIRRGRDAIFNRMQSYTNPTDEQALDDFKTTHYAIEVPDIFNHSQNIDRLLEEIYDKIAVKVYKDDFGMETTIYEARLNFGVEYAISDFQLSQMVNYGDNVDEEEKYFRDHIKKSLAREIYNKVNSLD